MAAGSTKTLSSDELMELIASGSDIPKDANLGKRTNLNTLTYSAEGTDEDPSYLNGWPLLCVAAHRGNPSAVEFLLEKGASPTARVPRSNYTALILAAEMGHVEVIKALGPAAGPELCGDDDTTAASIVLREGYFGRRTADQIRETLTALKNIGVTLHLPPHQRDADTTWLHWLATDSKIDLLRVWRDLDGDMDFKAVDKRESLLIERYGDMRSKKAASEADGATAEASSAYTAERDYLLELISVIGPKALNCKDGAGFTLMHYATRDGDVDLVHACLAAGASPFVTTPNGWTFTRATAKEVQAGMTLTEWVNYDETGTLNPETKKALHTAINRSISEKTISTSTSSSSHAAVATTFLDGHGRRSRDPDAAASRGMGND